MSGAETAYLYLSEDIVKETSGGIATNYLHGIGIDDPVMMERAGAKSYYFSDGLGSIREMTDAVGTIQNNYTYGAWGELRAQNMTVPNSYGYTGREFSEDGLYFYRARYLNPGVGRFIAEDPIGYNGGINLYEYGNNNPINFIDPSGKGCIPLLIWPYRKTTKDKQYTGESYWTLRSWHEEYSHGAEWWEAFLWHYTYTCFYDLWRDYILTTTISKGYKIISFCCSLCLGCFFDEDLHITSTKIKEKKGREFLDSTTEEFTGFLSPRPEPWVEDECKRLMPKNRK